MENYNSESRSISVQMTSDVSTSSIYNYHLDNNMGITVGSALMRGLSTMPWTGSNGSGSRAFVSCYASAKLDAMFASRGCSQKKINR